jgi:tRNA-dihydrouridine synthase B
LQAFSSTDGAVDTGNSLVSKGELSILIPPFLSTAFVPRTQKYFHFLIISRKYPFDCQGRKTYLPLAMHNTLPFAPNAPWLAPLAGYSDLSFRMLCRSFGAACAVTEMVSAKGLVYGGHGTTRLLTTAEGDAPLVVQLFGAEPSIFERAMPQLLERGFTHFDLNCGCSVRKVNKSGSGSALMARPENLLKVAEVMLRAAGPHRVGVKMRLGIQQGEENFIELGQRLADLGAGWLTLHPRTARQLFGGRANWSAIGQLARAVDIPVLASGDLFTAEDAARCLAETGCAGVMFARGALTDPFIFQRLRDLLAGRESAPRTPESLAATTALHIRLARNLDGTPRALRALRAFLPRYAKGFSGIRALRQALLQCSTWEELEATAAGIATLCGTSSPLGPADHAHFSSRSILADQSEPPKQADQPDQPDRQIDLTGGHGA